MCWLRVPHLGVEEVWCTAIGCFVTRLGCPDSWGFTIVGPFPDQYSLNQGEFWAIPPYFTCTVLTTLVGISHSCLARPSDASTKHLVIFRDECHSTVWIVQFFDQIHREYLFPWGLIINGRAWPPGLRQLNIGGGSPSLPSNRPFPDISKHKQRPPSHELTLPTRSWILT